MEQNRFKSPVVWASIATLFVGLLMQIGVIGDSENQQIMTVVGTAIELLTVIGVLNNPTSKDSF